MITTTEPSESLRQAFRDWNERRAYIKSGNYHVKSDGSSSGPIAPWNKEVKRRFASCSEFHATAAASRGEVR